jgi:hypothetical protein
MSWLFRPLEQQGGECQSLHGTRGDKGSGLGYCRYQWEWSWIVPLILRLRSANLRPLSKRMQRSVSSSDSRAGGCCTKEQLDVGRCVEAIIHETMCAHDTALTGVGIGAEAKRWQPTCRTCSQQHGELLRQGGSHRGKAVPGALFHLRMLPQRPRRSRTRLSGKSSVMLPTKTVVCLALVWSMPDPRGSVGSVTWQRLVL